MYEGVPEPTGSPRGVTMRKATAAVAFTVAVGLGLFVPAHANETGDECVPQEAWTDYTDWVASSPGEGWYQVEEETVVDQEAWTETVVVEEAWTETVIVEEAVPAVWANWQPNETQGPQNYTPVWPSDDRGTWISHDSIPGGHEGPDGVYQQGSGNSPWFYRQAGKEAVTKEVHHPEVTKEIHHEAETHPEYRFAFDHPEVVCEEDPVDPVEPDEPKEPEDPKPEDPKPGDPKPGDPKPEEPKQPEEPQEPQEPTPPQEEPQEPSPAPQGAPEQPSSPEVVTPAAAHSVDTLPATGTSGWMVLGLWAGLALLFGGLWLHLAGRVRRR